MPASLVAVGILIPFHSPNRWANEVYGIVLVGGASDDHGASTAARSATHFGIFGRRSLEFPATTSLQLSRVL